MQIDDLKKELVEFIKDGNNDIDKLVAEAKKQAIADVERIITINKNIIIVNLAATPILPFDKAEIEQHIGDGFAVIEKKFDGLYVNGHKVVLHLSKRQQDGKRLTGYELREELTGKPVLNASILDALYDNLHLIPEDWKKDEKGNIRYIFFWGTIYRNADGDLCVRVLYLRAGAWSRLYYWLDNDCYGNNPAALLAS